MVTAAEELKYLRLVKEGEFAKKDLSGNLLILKYQRWMYLHQSNLQNMIQ